MRSCIAFSGCRGSIFRAEIPDWGKTVLEGKERRIVGTAVFISTVADVIFLVCSFTGVSVIYDTGFYWSVLQVLQKPSIPGEHAQKQLFYVWYCAV